MNIRNNHDAPLHVGNITIRPGATVAIDNWDVVKNTTMAKSLLGGKMIEEVLEVIVEKNPKRIVKED